MKYATTKTKKSGRPKKEATKGAKTKASMSLTEKSMKGAEKKLTLKEARKKANKR